MRWKLCKIYQKRVDDPMFDEMNDAQFLWYQAQINLDLKEQYELLRDVAEHNAMFMNPEGVQQVRDARENSFETTDEEFEQILEEQFGRSISLTNSNTKPISESEIIGMIKCDDEVSKYSPIVDMDLDDVKFTPF